MAFVESRRSSLTFHPVLVLPPKTILKRLSFSLLFSKRVPRTVQYGDGYKATRGSQVFVAGLGRISSSELFMPLLRTLTDSGHLY